MSSTTSLMNTQDRRNLTDSMSLLHKVNSGMGSPGWHVSMCRHPPSKIRKILWVYCPGHAGVKGNGRTDRLAGAKQPSQAGYVSEDVKW